MNSGDLVTLNDKITICSVIYASNDVYVSDRVGICFHRDSVSIVLCSEFNELNNLQLLVINSKLNVMGWVNASCYTKVSE